MTHARVVLQKQFQTQEKPSRLVEPSPFSLEHAGIFLTNILKALKPSSPCCSVFTPSESILPWKTSPLLLHGRSHQISQTFEPWEKISI